MNEKPKIVKHAGNTRIPYICQVRTANMIYNGYIIGTISEERNDADEFDWVIKMDWKEWKKSGYPQVAGIYGLKTRRIYQNIYSGICRGENSSRYKRWVMGRIR